MTSERRGNYVGGWLILTPRSAFRDARHLGLIDISAHLSWYWYLTDGARWTKAGGTL